MQTKRIVPILARVAAAVALPALAATALAALAATAATATTATTEVKGDVAATIKKTVESRFSGTKVIDVQPSPVPGLYEVFMGDRIVYSDASGDHVIVGSMLDSRTLTDLTQARMDERGAIDFKSLPFDKAIKIVKGNGSRQLAVFEDPDCPFCQKLEHEFATIPDTTVYVFLFPIDSLHPQATTHARAIWCAPNRAQAWTQWLLEKKPPPAASCNTDPIGELAKLGAKLYIDGTPTMFLADGKRVGGAIPTADLEKLLLAQGKPANATPGGAGHAGEPAKNPQSR